MADPSRALILGWRGGVGQALLGLLARHPRGRAVLDDLQKLVLVDEADGPRPALPECAIALEPERVTSADRLADLVTAHGIGVVVEVAWVDTYACVRACAQLGADLLCTSLERWPDPSPDRHAPENRILIDARRLLPPARPRVTGSHLVGSGMNPGIVNALVEAGLAAFAERTGTAPDPAALELGAILVTEEDDTTAPGEDGRRFATTWNPECAIEELFEPEAMYVDRCRAVGLGHAPTEATYRARCGDHLIDGWIVPHDELVTLGHRHRGVELAFVYRLPPATRAFVARHRGEDPGEFPLGRLYPPHRRELEGRDRVGVLLCSRRFGELWIGFDTDCARARSLGTNATELQVAAGVLAGWQQLGRISGVHVVEELDARQFVGDVEAILGPASVIHDPHAPFVPLPARRRS